MLSEQMQSRATNKVQTQTRMSSNEAEDLIPVKTGVIALEQEQRESMLVIEKEPSHMSISEMPAPSDSILNSKWFGQK